MKKESPAGQRFNRLLNAIPDVQKQIEIEDWVADEKGKIIDSLTYNQRLNLNEDIFDHIYIAAIQKIEEVKK